MPPACLAATVGLLRCAAVSATTQRTEPVAGVGFEAAGDRGQRAYLWGRPHRY